MNMLKAVGAHNRDPLANVVFVHGIGSSSETAWRSPNSKEKAAFPEWLSQDLEQHAGAPVNVWQVDYPAEIFRVMFLSVSRDDSVPQRADMLRDLVSSQQLTRRPVIFIAHSLGGILVKDMLRGSIDMRQYRDVGGAGNRKPFNLALSTKLVVFVSTPHDGSSVANIASVVPDLSKATLQALFGLVNWLPAFWPVKLILAPIFKAAVRLGPFTDALKRRDPHLEDLGVWYRHNAPQLQIETKAYYENQKYKLPGRFSLRTLTVVTRDSANPGVSGCETIGLEGDHASICKPDSREHDNYRTILSAVSDVLDRRCPAFVQTHQAVLDIGESFVRLTELHRADRLAATKKVVQPIEVLLGRKESMVDYTSSAGSQEGFKPEQWQLARAACSDYDLDRVIFYVYCERVHGLPLHEPEMYVRQETERLRATLERTKDITLIPLHYAVRALRRRIGHKETQLTDASREQLNRTGDLVRTLVTSPEEHKELLMNIEALLAPPQVVS